MLIDVQESNPYTEPSASGQAEPCARLSVDGRRDGGSIFEVEGLRPGY